MLARFKKIKAPSVLSLFTPVIIQTEVKLTIKKAEGVVI